MAQPQGNVSLQPAVRKVTRSVLVVEDEEDIRELVSYTLLKEGYQVAGVASGEEALAAAEARAPDLVLLDLMLPGVDGLTVCQKLRSNPATSGAAIVMLTAKGEERDIVAGLLGVEPDKVRGRLVHEVIRKSSLLEIVDRTLSSPSPVEEDFELGGPESRWLHAHGMALVDAQRRPIGALVVLHDVTRLRHLENVRRDFVANVSHELRTPITSIKGFVETLFDEKLEDRENSLRFLGIVLKQVNRLDAIIQDLLMLSRVERGAEEQTIHLETERLSEVLRSAVEMCEKKASDKRITVEVHCPDDLTASPDSLVSSLS